MRKNDALRDNPQTTPGSTMEEAHLVGSNPLHAANAKGGPVDQAKAQLQETIGAVKEAGNQIRAGVEDGTKEARENS